jgi:EAL domain-containing protein (putative c-di-GMP-specific phosphodiesterase class I)
MKNVTITLKGEVARWVRIKAAERNITVSRLVREILQDKMHAEESYRLAMEQYLSQGPQMLKQAGTGFPRREALYRRLSIPEY